MRVTQGTKNSPGRLGEDQVGGLALLNTKLYFKAAAWDCSQINKETGEKRARNGPGVVCTSHFPEESTVEQGQRTAFSKWWNA